MLVPFQGLICEQTSFQHLGTVCVYCVGDSSSCVSGQQVFLSDRRKCICMVKKRVKLKNTFNQEPPMTRPHIHLNVLLIGRGRPQTRRIQTACQHEATLPCGGVPWHNFRDRICVPAISPNCTDQKKPCVSFWSECSHKLPIQDEEKSPVSRKNVCLPLPSPHTHQPNPTQQYFLLLPSPFHRSPRLRNHGSQQSAHFSF